VNCLTLLVDAMRRYVLSASEFHANDTPVPMPEPLRYSQTRTPGLRTRWRGFLASRVRRRRSNTPSRALRAMSRAATSRSTITPRNASCRSSPRPKIYLQHVLKRITDHLISRVDDLLPCNVYSLRLSHSLIAKYPLGFMWIHNKLHTDRRAVARTNGSAQTPTPKHNSAAQEPAPYSLRIQGHGGSAEGFLGSVP
jgi:hypothetical protein